MILFFSDLHIHHTHRFSHITPEGRTFREFEHLMCADKIIELVKKHNIDRIVFGGDLFAAVGDNLSTQCLDTACEFLNRLQENCKDVAIDLLVGNHDTSSHINNQYSHKLVAFKNWKNITVYDQPTMKGNYVYMPFCINDLFATVFLESIEDKENKIIFSHLELKNINLGNGIFSQKGVDYKLLDEFKLCLQGHYHSGGKYGKKIHISGSTQRFSFKDQGIARKNIIILDEESGKLTRESFDCPDWLVFNDDNIDNILKTNSDNYVRVELTSDIFLTEEIQDKLKTFKGTDVHIDVTRITVNKKIEEDFTIENEVDVIKQFIDKSNNTEEQKTALLQEGIDLINKVK